MLLYSGWPPLITLQDTQLPRNVLWLQNLPSLLYLDCYVQTHSASAHPHVAISVNARSRSGKLFIQFVEPEVEVQVYPCRLDRKGP